MKTSLYLMMILLFNGMTSCKKEALVYTIEGTILNQVSKESVVDVTVKLYQKEYKNGVLSDNYTFVNEVKTNSQGQYAFEIERVKIYEIKLTIDDPNYYFKSSVYSSGLLSTENTNYFDESIEAKSWVAIVLKNPFIGPEELLNLHKSKFREGCEACCTNGNSTFFETGDTTIVCATVGGADVILNYGVEGNNSQLSKTITCIPFDTTFFTINY